MHEFFSSNLGLVTDRQTDRQKAMHKSPPYMSTGGLKNHSIPMIFSSFPKRIARFHLVKGDSSRQSVFLRRHDQAHNATGYA